MLTCAETTALLLDYLYGLLDGDDAQHLQSHLAGCPACQAQLEQAKAQPRQRRRGRVDTVEPAGGCCGAAGG